jgi:phosphatidylinositol alpha-mannosyltransferase
MLDEEQFDVIHFHEPWVPMVSRQILTRSKSVNIATSHAKIPDGLTTKALVNVVSSYTKALLKYIDAYSAVSEPAAEYIKGFTDNKIEIVPNGIDLKKYNHSLKKHTKQKTILYIGRLEKRKGVGYLLEAFKELSKHHQDVQLVIAGDGELRSRFELWVKQHRVPRVKFLGFVSDRRKHTLLNNADLFCSPALYGESFGIVLLEAMAMGLVTVAGNNPGYASVMRGVGKASLFDPRDTKQFSEKLEKFLYNEKQREEWKKWAKQYVQQFDYPKIVDKYERLYKHGLKNSQK